MVWPPCMSQHGALGRKGCTAWDDAEVESYLSRQCRLFGSLGLLASGRVADGQGMIILALVCASSSMRSSNGLMPWRALLLKTCVWR